MSAKFKRFIVMATLMISVAFAYAQFNPERPSDYNTYGARDVVLSDHRAQHILYGDARGGGHKYGIGAPCKSEFPRDWDEGRILDVTKRIAANDNLNWREEYNGYYVTETMEDDVRVRVVLGREKRKIITAYPTNMPRNPCPANDNRYNN